jgi:hypothetical protein
MVAPHWAAVQVVFVQHWSFSSQTWSVLAQQPLPVQMTPLGHVHVPSVQVSPG